MKGSPDMKINEIYPANKELTPEEIWLLTSDSSAVPIKKTVEIDTIEIETAVFYDDVSEKTGEVKEILSILGKDGRVYATNSPYFIRDFRKMVELFTQMGKPLDRVAVVRSVSGKTGRDFITCSVVR